MGSAARQDLGQVHRADGGAGARERSLNLHQATGIERDHRAGAGALDGLDFGARHGAGKLGEFHREGAAETAALLGRLHLAQFQPAHVRQQPPRGLRMPSSRRAWQPS